MKTPLLRVAALVLVLAQAGCGLILYPEREGQPKTGRIDPTVAILDGVGCLFFLIPGLIAFAVDFHEGTIYLPPDESAGGAAAWRSVAATGALTPEAIERVVRAETGRELSLADPRLQAYRVRDPDARVLAGVH
jgi:hypothetical protein